MKRELVVRSPNGEASNYRLILVTTLLLVISVCSSCAKEGGHGESLPGQTTAPIPRADASVVPEGSTLDATLVDAIDLVIAQNAMSGALNRPKLSPDLMARLSKHNGVRFSADIRGVTNTFDKGVVTHISPSSRFIYSLEGALDAEIRILNGSVGLSNGEIAIGEETQALVNGTRYAFKLGRWVGGQREVGWTRAKVETGGEGDEEGEDEDDEEELRVRCWRNPDDPECRRH